MTLAIWLYIHYASINSSFRSRCSSSSMFHLSNIKWNRSKYYTCWVLHTTESARTSCIILVHHSGTISTCPVSDSMETFKRLNFTIEYRHFVRPTWPRSHWNFTWWMAGIACQRYKWRNHELSSILMFPSHAFSINKTERSSIFNFQITWVGKRISGFTAYVSLVKLDIRGTCCVTFRTRIIQLRRQFSWAKV